jgi:hypothetical protein
MAPQAKRRHLPALLRSVMAKAQSQLSEKTNTYKQEQNMTPINKGKEI